MKGGGAGGRKLTKGGTLNPKVAICLTVLNYLLIYYKISFIKIIVLEKMLDFKNFNLIIFFIPEILSNRI